MPTTDDLKRELFRNAILLQLDSAAPATLNLAAIRQGVRLLGHLPSPPALRRELDYLIDKGLCTFTDHPLNQRAPRYRITATGRDYLEAEGLA